MIGDKCMQNFSLNLKGIDHLEDQGEGGRIILKMDFRDVGSKSVDWIQLGREGTGGGLL
jgi:hypothetical protein